MGRGGLGRKWPLIHFRVHNGPWSELVHYKVTSESGTQPRREMGTNAALRRVD